MKYKYIEFVKIAEKPKTSVWSCRNKKSGGELGTIAWYFFWRQYCYYPHEGCIYSGGCLKDIADFIEGLKK